MAIWKTAMAWLGLGPDSDYEQAPDAGRGFADPAWRGGESPDGAGYGYDEAVAPMSAGGAPGGYAPDRDPNDFSAVRSLGPVVADEQGSDSEMAGSPGRPLTAMTNTALRPMDAGMASRPGAQAMGSVRAVPASGHATPQLVAPRSFNEAQEVADRFRGGAPVLLNLRECDSELGRRLIDFCSGLCYGLRGQMERVSDRVFLVIPSDVQLSAEDRRSMRDSGLLN